MVALTDDWHINPEASAAARTLLAVMDACTPERLAIEYCPLAVDLRAALDLEISR